MKTLISAIFILFYFNLNAEEVNFEYQWTDRHPVLTEYVTENKDLIKKFTPYKIRKSKEYIDYIKYVFRNEGLPEEMFILAAIESGFREKVKSHANAKGMWQFTKATAREWGLVVNDKVDERKDWKKSTQAAARYLKWMAEKHFNGDYESAILAYNAGIGRIKDAMEKYETNDPWVLIEINVLPEESNNFLPKFITYLHYFHYLENKKLLAKK